MGYDKCMGIVFRRAGVQAHDMSALVGKGRRNNAAVSRFERDY
jgi:hypothetical protein